MVSTIQQKRESEYDERFGFETSGSFHCQYSTETVYLVLLAVLAVGGCIAIFIFLSSVFISEYFRFDPSVSLFLALAIIVGWGLLLFICLILFKLIIKGSEYYYKADEQKLTIFHRQQNTDFFYMNIMNVRYEPLMLLRKQRGFTITVVTRKGTHTFKYIYGNIHAHMTPENTPFYILEVRSGLRKVSDPDLYFKHKREHQTAYEQALENGELDRPIKYNERLHPAATEIKQPISEDELIIAKGSFSAPRSMSSAMFIAVIAFCILVISFSLIRLLSSLLHGNVLSQVYPTIFAIIICGVALAVYRVANYRKYTYEADSKEFRITDSKGRRETIYYNDVNEVCYKKLKFFGRHSGYKVDIITKYRTITYNWLFLKNRKFQKTSETPFYVIEEHITK